MAKKSNDIKIKNNLPNYFNIPLNSHSELSNSSTNLLSDSPTALDYGNTDYGNSQYDKSVKISPNDILSGDYCGYCGGDFFINPQKN